MWSKTMTTTRTKVIWFQRRIMFCLPRQADSSCRSFSTQIVHFQREQQQQGAGNNNTRSIPSKKWIFPAMSSTRVVADYWRHQKQQQQRCRSFSSRSRSQKKNNSNSSFQLDALSFSVSPEAALSKFQKWAVDEQGLNYLLQWNKIKISASYVPVWSFDLNVRFVTTSPEQGGKKRYDWKPQPFRDAYPSNHNVIHIPGLAMYAGHTYRRSLINPLHETALVFMGDKTMPFGTWMLKDMKFINPTNGESSTMEVFPDPWNTTRGRALTLLQDELEDLVHADPDISNIDADNVQVQTELVQSRRVYMPTFVIDYSVLGGAEYRAFVSGCDAGASVSGVSHQVFSFSNQEVYQASTSFLSQVSNAARAGIGIIGTRNVGGVLMLILNLLGNVMVRVLARIPIISLIGGAFVGFRKLVRPWMDNRSASAEWERQRDHETYMHDHHEHPTDDFVDTTGAAKRYFQQHKTQILRHLSGEYTHEEGDFEWYKDWEEWARRQWEQQQQQTYQQQQQQQQQTYQRQRPKQQQKPKSKPEYQWDFNPNDPYSVLGIRRGATKSEVSAAFRKEMLKHHPDVQANASDAEKARSVERSKLITNAYRQIKAEMK